MNLILAFVIFTGIAWFPGQAWELEVGTVQPSSPAAVAGLMVGDAVVSVDGRYYDQFGGFQPLMTELQAHPGQTVHLGVVRANGTLADVPVTLRPTSQIDTTHKALGVGFVAFRPSPIGFTRNPVDAVTTGAARTEEAFRLIADGLGQIANSIATKPTEAPPASGPVGIAVQVGDVFWQAGPLATLYLAGILSANLALVNVLPFPPLDGGRMLMLVIKRIAGSRVSVKAERLTYLVGFAFLFAFLIWITYFDIARIGAGAQ
jgi:regulator of sigma E protease